MDGLEDKLFHSPAGKQWKRIGIKPHHGVDVPLFSMRSKKSCGIGEFLDLIPLIDWCHNLKMDVIQLLPLNDSGNDPSPYNALSSCALNPLYISLFDLPHLNDFPSLKKKLSHLRDLNASQRLAYHEVKDAKLSWLREYYEKTGESLLKKKDYEDFVKDQPLPWLEPYALFKALKDVNQDNHWATWTDPFKAPSEKEYGNLLKKYEKDVSFYKMLQYLSFTQLKAVKDYANSQGVFLKGDIPILISSDSADVWHAPELFDMTLAAGAPPDPYNLDGQYWGFPLFNWELIKQKHYAWWKRRLNVACPLYDIYRIDHVVGFFRIWAIPLGKESKFGKFMPEDKSHWIPQGKEILEVMLSATPMLPIAEDLGSVPNEVRKQLLELGICGTKIMRWERMWDEDKRFIPLNYYPPVSMTCVSTHDSQTLQLWWRDTPEEAKAFAEYKHWTYTKELSLSQRKEILWESHHTSSIFHINLLQEYLALFAELVWPKLEDELINQPGTILPTNWTYRFRPYIEELVAHKGLQEEIKKIIYSTEPLSL